jgi:hypothetical protein
VAPSRPSARPLIAALLAVVLTVALAAVILGRAAAAAEAPGWMGAAGGTGILAVLVISAAVLTARPGAVGWGVALLAAEYAVFLIGRGVRLDPAAPLLGAGLVLAAEVSITACEWRGPHAVDATVELRHWSRVVLAAAAGAAVGGGGLVLAAAIPGSVPGLVLGAAGIVGLVGIAAWLRAALPERTQPAP